jgi:hypothetical protein
LHNKKKENKNCREHFTCFMRIVLYRLYYYSNSKPFKDKVYLKLIFLKNIFLLFKFEDKKNLQFFSIKIYINFLIALLFILWYS